MESIKHLINTVSSPTILVTIILLTFFFIFPPSDWFYKCNNLLDDTEQLQKIQDELLKWWNNQILFMHELIMKEL